MPEREFVDTSSTQARPNSEYGSVIANIAQRSICPFCPEHINGIHPNPIVEENNTWLATDSAYPYEHVASQILLIHREHIEDIRELSAQGWTELNDILTTMVDRRELEGATLLMRFGKTALTGASVRHLHAMLVTGTGDPHLPVIARVG